MEIKVLGSGCKSCKKLYEDVSSVITELKLEANVEYVTDITKLMEYGIMSVPALIIDEKVVSTGKSLSKKEIETVLNGTCTFNENGSCNCGK